MILNLCTNVQNNEFYFFLNQKNILILKKIIKMDFIHLENMEFYAYHGHYLEEQKIGNKYKISLSLKTNLQKAAISDKLEDTINYYDVYQIIKKEMKNQSSLLENIAYRIIKSIFENFLTVELVTLKISKMNPPVGGIMECVTIEMTRSRDMLI